MNKVLRRMFTNLIIIAFGVYLVMVAYVYIRQGGMLFFPEKRLEATPALAGLAYEDIIFKTKDGVDISAWFIPAQGVSRGVLHFSHGNAGNISHRLEPILLFHRLGLDVFIYDYRGYGKSGGSPSEEGTYRDAEAGWDYLVNKRGIPAEKIIFYGHSLGSAVAAEAAMRNKCGALIIDSGFTSVPDLGSKFFPYMPVHLISRYHYATVKKVGRINCPKLVIHSPEDEIVPFEQGISLFEKASAPKEFLEIRGGHNDGFIVSEATYVSGIDDFVSKYLPAR